MFEKQALQITECIFDFKKKEKKKKICSLTVGFLGDMFPSMYFSWMASLYICCVRTSRGLAWLRCVNSHTRKATDFSPNKFKKKTKRVFTIYRQMTNMGITPIKATNHCLHLEGFYMQVNFMHVMVTNCIYLPGLVSFFLPLHVFPFSILFLLCVNKIGTQRFLCKPTSIETTHIM